MSRRPNAALTASAAEDTHAASVLRLQRVVYLDPEGSVARPPVSLEIPQGGAHVITGGPGSGKSLLLRMIGLARAPRLGGLELFGQDVNATPPALRYGLRRRIGIMFQDLRLIGELSVRDNIALAAHAAERERATLDRDIAELLAWVGLARRSAIAAIDLDEEGRRRLALSRALINRPDIVLADEPAGRTGQGLLSLLADLNGAGTAILLATRDGTLAANAGAEITHLGRNGAGV
jgi:cell division transport system ATP-binding protein